MHGVMKKCLQCGQVKAAAGFYGAMGACKACHNAACVARRRRDPAYQARQYAAKRRWTLANRQTVRVHQRRGHGRLIWDGPKAAPLICQQAEAALWALWDAISAPNH